MMSIVIDNLWFWNCYVGGGFGVMMYKGGVCLFIVLDVLQDDVIGCLREFNGPPGGVP